MYCSSVSISINHTKNQKKNPFTRDRLRSAAIGGIIHGRILIVAQKARKSSQHFDVSQSQAIELIVDRRSTIAGDNIIRREIPNHPSPIAVRVSIDTYDITDYDYGARVLFMYAKRIMRNICRWYRAKLSLFNTLQ